MNYCKDCKHYHAPSAGEFHGCDWAKRIDPVDGSNLLQNCREMRGREGGCGPEGFLFEPNEAALKDLDRQGKMREELGFKP